MNGIIGEINTELQEAADHRHSPVINRVQLVANHEDVPVGELLFDTASGATSASGAASTKTAAGDGTKTEFTFQFGKVLPGSVKVATDDATAKKITDNGDGTLGGESEDGTGTVDYVTGDVSVAFSAAPANGKTVTVRAAEASKFIGVANHAAGKDEDDGINVVLHGTIAEGIAKVDGVTATPAQIKFLRTCGIYQ